MMLYHCIFHVRKLPHPRAWAKAPPRPGIFGAISPDTCSCLVLILSAKPLPYFCLWPGKTHHAFPIECQSWGSESWVTRSRLACGDIIYILSIVSSCGPSKTLDQTS